MHLAMFLHHNRLGLWRSWRICKTSSRTFLPYLLLTRSSSPTQGGTRTKSRTFLRARVRFPQGLVVSTCYNFGEVGIRQCFPSLSKVPAAATKLAHPFGLHLLVFQVFILEVSLMLVLGSAGDILTFSLLISCGLLYFKYLLFLF